MTKAEAAETLRVSIPTLDALARQPGGPRPIVIGTRNVRYSVASLRRWIAEQEQRQAAETQP